MRWVAPAEKDTANETMEKRLWAAADQFRANSGLKAGQYSTAPLGLIFLRFVQMNFATGGINAQISYGDCFVARDCA